MQPVFDRYAQVVAWLKDETIYDLSGVSRAYLSGEKVVTNGGHHIGNSRDGYFRDLDGYAVAFLREAKGHPVTPAPVDPPPSPEFAPLPPYRPTPTFSRNSYVVSPYWSPLDWGTYLK